MQFTCLICATKHQENASGFSLTQSETQYQPRQDRQCIHKPNTEAPSWNHFFCRGEAISITYSECVSLALVIQHAKHMRRNVNVICGLSGCTAFFVHYLTNGRIFEKIWTIKICVSNSSSNLFEIRGSFQKFCTMYVFS